MPVVLPSFSSEAELNAWFRQNFSDTNDRTHSPSFFRELPDSEVYIREVEQQTTRRGKDAWLSRYIHDGLRWAPPIREQAWLMNRNFFERAMAYLTMEAGLEESPLKKLIQRYDEFIPANAACNDPEVIILYRQACEEFRTKLNLTDPASLTGMLVGSVTTKVEVPQSLAQTLRDMLVRMKQQSQHRLGKTDSKTTSSTLLTGVKAFLRSMGRIPPPVPLNKRNGLAVQGFKPSGGQAVQSEENGALLITTAIMQLKAKGDTEIEDLVAKFAGHFTGLLLKPTLAAAEKARAHKMLGYVSCWKKEAAVVADLTTGAGAFHQQGSGIDVVFSSYLWAFLLDCKTYDNFAELNGLLVGIAQNPQGRARMNAVLQEMGTPLAVEVTRKMSKCQDIHLPPFVLNVSRMYDFVATFGAFPIDDVRCEGLEGFSSSPRYVLNLKRESGEGLALIAVSWGMWRASYGGRPSVEEISEAEHLFHQFLLRKTSPFQNTHLLTGNALDVVLVPVRSAVYDSLGTSVPRQLRDDQEPEAVAGPSGIASAQRAGFGRGQQIPQ
nr:MAG: nucleocapsid protein [Nairoviridae sp.]